MPDTVLTWGDVLDEAGHRLKFVQNLLDYQPDEDHSLEYLRKTHEKYLPSGLQATPDAQQTVERPSSDEPPD